MLVRFVFLRFQGVKLPSAAIRESVGDVAELTVHDFYGDIKAMLTYPWHGTPAGGTKVPRLDGCRIRSIKGNALVLHGTETFGMLHDQKTVPQAWWCRMAPENDRPPMDPPHPAAAAYLLRQAARSAVTEAEIAREAPDRPELRPAPDPS